MVLEQCEAKLSKVFQRKAAEKEEKGGISINISAWPFSVRGGNSGQFVGGVGGERA